MTYCQVFLVGKHDESPNSAYLFCGIIYGKDPTSFKCDPTHMMHGKWFSPGQLQQLVLIFHYD